MLEDRTSRLGLTMAIVLLSVLLTLVAILVLLVLIVLVAHKKSLSSDKESAPPAPVNKQSTTSPVPAPPMNTVDKEEPATPSTAPMNNETTTASPPATSPVNNEPATLPAASPMNNEPATPPAASPVNNETTVSPPTASPVNKSLTTPAAAPVANDPTAPPTPSPVNKDQSMPSPHMSHLLQQPASLSPDPTTTAADIDNFGDDQNQPVTLDTVEDENSSIENDLPPMNPPPTPAEYVAAEPQDRTATIDVPITTSGVVPFGESGTYSTELTTPKKKRNRKKKNRGAKQARSKSESSEGDVQQQLPAPSVPPPSQPPLASDASPIPTFEGSLVPTTEAQAYQINATEESNNEYSHVISGRYEVMDVHQEGELVCGQEEEKQEPPCETPTKFRGPMWDYL